MPSYEVDNVGSLTDIIGHRNSTVESADVSEKN